MMVKGWKGSKCLSADECIHGMWSLHSVEYYLAIKMNEALMHATNVVEIQKHYAK